MTQEYTPEQARIDVTVGERFVVRLAANPTTGHEWQPMFDPAWLELLGSEFVPPEAGIGTGGVERLDWRAKAAGVTWLCLAYRRPWEAGAPAEQVAFEVVCRSPGAG